MTHSFTWLRNLIEIALLLAIGLPIVAAAQDIRTHRYQVAINPELSSAQVNICFAGKVPEYLIVDYKKATRNILEFPKTQKGFIEFQGRYWKTQSLAPNSCVNYRVDISEHKRKRRSAENDKTQISFQTENTWLWLPEALSEDEQVEIEFQIPDSYRVSTPWQMLDNKGHRFLLGRTPHDWGFTIIIGEFQLRPVKLASGSQLNIAVLNQVKQKNALKQWVVDIGETLSDYLGHFPLSQLQVILIENRRFRTGPVPWGDVKRGGGFGIRFVVDSDQSLEKFYQDWTATHEFSHLLVPNIEYQDGWLSEGLASYLQYLLMARSGQLTPEQAWQKLYLGFNRGLNGTVNAPEEKLINTSENRRKGNRSGRTMRIYWSGAVYFFMADVELRKQSKGQLGLPELLLKLNQCCIDSRDEWSGIRLAKKLDELSDKDIFVDLYRNIAYSKDFPDFMQTFNELGIQVENEQVTFDSQASFQLRDQIIYRSSSLKILGQ